MQLNNWLQEHGRPTSSLSYEMSFTGPRHNREWTAVATLNGVEHGRGTGPNQDAAKEAAAKEALQALQLSV